jgi:omega-amidase
MASITARPFKLALVQLAGLGKDKTANLAVAAKGVSKAVTEGKADLVVLPVRPIHIRDIIPN